MAVQEDYVFWKLADYFISEHGYRMIQLSGDQDELWLERMEDKNIKAIRLLKYDLEWSNWMQRDIEVTAEKAESVRNQLGKREMPVLNIYVSAYLPVDDYEFRITDPFMPENGKASVQSMIIESGKPESLHAVEEIFEKPLTLPSGNYTEMDADALKHTALSKAVKTAKKKRKCSILGSLFHVYIYGYSSCCFFTFGSNGRQYRYLDVN